MGALGRGLVAGAIGAAVQSLFFVATRRWTPAPTTLPRELQKPEIAARKESPRETVARRTVDNMMKRGPLEGDAKEKVASAIHYAFGAMWGGLYALCRESFPTSPVLFGAGVWMASGNFLLPAFRLAA